MHSYLWVLLHWLAGRVIIPTCYQLFYDRVSALAQPRLSEWERLQNESELYELGRSAREWQQLWTCQRGADPCANPELADCVAGCCWTLGGDCNFVWTSKEALGTSCTVPPNPIRRDWHRQPPVGAECRGPAPAFHHPVPHCGHSPAAVAFWECHVSSGGFPGICVLFCQRFHSGHARRVPLSDFGAPSKSVQPAHPSQGDHGCCAALGSSLLPWHPPAGFPLSGHPQTNPSWPRLLCFPVSPGSAHLWTFSLCHGVLASSIYHCCGVQQHLRVPLQEPARRQGPPGGALPEKSDKNDSHAGGGVHSMLAALLRPDAGLAGREQLRGHWNHTPLRTLQRLRKSHGNFLHSNEPHPICADVPKVQTGSTKAV